MPFRIDASLAMDRPADHVWQYLIAFEQVPLWEHGILEIRQLTEGPAALGTEVVARRLYAGREAQLRGSITAFEDGRSATMSLSGGPFDGSIVTYAVEPIDPSRSLVRYGATGSIRGPLRFVHPVISALGRAESRKNLAKLKRRIDAGIPARSNAPTP